MIPVRSSLVVGLAVALAVASSWDLSEARPQGPPPPAVQQPAPTPGLPPRTEAGPQEGVEPLGRGPIHEAFAQPTPTKPQAGPIVPKKPPEPVPEQPPDQKQEGENVQWIPGYWFWAPENKDFVWVSGFWRVTPPGRRWVPGYWTAADGGSQWTPGFWAPANQTDLQYLPAPPPSVESGPSVPAPDDQSTYVPGSWVFQDGEYVWQPGYWAQGQTDYLYTPSYYSWTPSGYVYVNGYWDYPLADRGLLFAPVLFSRPFWATGGWYYRPWYTVSAASILDSLFCWPSHNSYLFGDFYGASFASNFGIYPWWWWGRRSFDPLFGFYGWQHRHDRGWYAGLRDRYWGRFDGTLVRPARTWSEQRRLVAGGQVHGHVLTPLNRVDVRAHHLTTVRANHLSAERASLNSFRQLSVQRSRVETAGRAFRLPADPRAVRVAGAAARPPVHENRLVSPGPAPSGRSVSSSAGPGNWQCRGRRSVTWRRAGTAQEPMSRRRACRRSTTSRTLTGRRRRRTSRPRRDTSAPRRCRTYTRRRRSTSTRPRTMHQHPMAAEVMGEAATAGTTNDRFVAACGLAIAKPQAACFIARARSESSASSSALSAEPARPRP
jgi:hypothetical protein